MARQTFLLLLFAACVATQAQNLINNPGFEEGAIPDNENQVSRATGWNNNCGRNYANPYPDGLPGSPDLFDTRSPNCMYHIPDNKWGNRPSRAGGNRYVGFSGAAASTGPQFYGETVEGTLAAPLTVRTYEVSFWAVGIDGIKYSCNEILQPTGPNPYNRVEVVLRKGNDCSSGKSVFTGGTVPQGKWQSFSGQFTLTLQDAQAGYDRIEFRLVQATGSNGFHIVYLDDVSLVAINQNQLPLDPALDVGGNYDKALTLCGDKPIPFHATNPGYVGVWTYAWTLYKDNAPIHTTTQQITCAGNPCPLASYSYNAPGSSGTYFVNLTVSGGSTSTLNTESVVVTAATKPVAKSTINGSADQTLKVCPGGPIVLDGSGSACVKAYFVSVQLSDQWWNRYGTEVMSWLTPGDYANFGAITSFDVRRFAEAYGLKIEPDKYYRVKLAVSDPLDSVTQVIYTTPPVSLFTVNGSPDDKLTLAQTSPIVVDATRSSCANSYFVSLQRSDASLGRYDVEAMKWLTAPDYTVFGPIQNLDIRKFAASQNFAIQPGNYYRLKIAVGPFWAESTKLLYVQP